MKRFKLLHLVRLGFIALWVLMIYFMLHFPGQGNKRNQKIISVLAWGDVFSPATLVQFEEKTGIKVVLNCFSSNEELLLKLNSSEGKNYDLIVPSDYAVKLLKNAGVLKKIDHARIQAFEQIDPLLKGWDYDPDLEYSIPYQWEVYGFGIDRNFFEKRSINFTLDQIFNEDAVNYPIAMVNDPIEAVHLATMYLFGATPSLDQKQLKKVKELLQKQKSWVEAYVKFRTEYFLATKSCPLALTTSSCVLRLAPEFDFIDFVIPEKDFFLTIENFCIPKDSEREDATYAFLNYILQDEVLAEQCACISTFPSMLGAYQFDTQNERKEKILRTVRERTGNVHFFDLLMPDQEYRKLWVELKSKN